MKTLVCDLDGTLYPKNIGEKKTSLEENFSAVRKWVSLGNKFVVATARGYFDYNELSEKLGFTFDFINLNGANLLFESGEMLIKTMPAAIYIDLCEYAKRENLDACVVTHIDGKWQWSSIENYPLHKEDFLRKERKYITLAEYDSIDRKAEIERIKLYITPEKREELKQVIIKMNYDVNISTSEVDEINITAKEASKGNSIVDLCTRYGIDIADVIVIGDDDNDISMFEIVSNSYCIDHAESHVRQKASKIVKSVVQAIESEIQNLETACT